MATHRLIHGAHGNTAAVMVGVACMLALSPLPAWTEEGGRAPLALEGDLPEEAPTDLPPATAGPLEAFGLSRTQPLALDPPWRHDSAEALAGLSQLEPACTPWNGGSTCSGESALLTDPWSADALARPSAVPSVVAEPHSELEPPAEGRPSTPALLAPSAPPAALVQETPEWTDLYGEPTRLPTAADLWEHRAVEPTSTVSPQTSASLDTWVVDPGVPETPFE